GDELFVHSRLPREIRLGGCRTDHEFPTGTDCPRQPCHRARRSRRGGRSATISRRLRNRTDRHHQGEPPGTGRRALCEPECGRLARRLPQTAPRSQCRRRRFVSDGSSEHRQPAHASPRVVTPTASPPMRVFDRTLHATTFNGTRLTYRVTGDSGAPPVVFVHGTLADLNSWGGQENLFAQRYRVLVYSRRYHRPNPQVEDNQTYSPKLHSED